MFWQPEIIGIQKCDILSPRFYNAAVARGTRPAIFLLEVANMQEVSLENLFQCLRVWRSIVYNDDLVVGEGLRQHRIQGSCYTARRIVCRNDYADRYSAAAVPAAACIISNRRHRILPLANTPFQEHLAFPTPPHPRRPRPSFT